MYPGLPEKSILAKQDPGSPGWFVSLYPGLPEKSRLAVALYPGLPEKSRLARQEPGSPGWFVSSSLSDSLSPPNLSPKNEACA